MRDVFWLVASRKAPPRNGEFATERKLGPYYTRHGYSVLAPGQTTDVGYILTGRPIGLGAGPGEQLFYRWK
ncbi:hypothetical protein [Streptomyces longisporoflavus]|uniref:Uncharacterized protein n=1 Tax=Streptomyces longisporoflavus TaxID=28044 RepID=A0ABW7R681_9ACTN